MELCNYMEQAVLRTLPSVLSRYPACCTCERCRQDIAIIALNNLPARYTSTDKGHVFAKLDSMIVENEMRIVEEIAKAIEIVSKEPRHEAQ